MTPKTITLDELQTASQKVIEEQERLAELSGKQFSGMEVGALVEELGKRFDPKDSAVIVHFKLTKDDINAAMNNRFYRGTGQKLLMGAAIIILALLLAAKYVPQFPTMAYYIGVVVVAGVFVLLYSRKQKAFKRHLSKGSPAIQKMRLGED